MSSVGNQRDKPSIIPMATLERRFWRGWLLLAAVSSLTTIGLAGALYPLLSGQFSHPWPWTDTGSALLVGLSILVTAFVAYLTYQQRETAALRRRYGRLQEQITERTERNNARLLALSNISRILRTDGDAQTVFDCITNMCVEIFGCHQASLMLFNKRTQELEARAAVGHLNIAEVMGTRQRIGEGIEGWVAEHCEPLLVVPPLDRKKYPDLELKDRTITAAIVAPIMVRAELVGVLTVSSRTQGARYDQEDLQALSVFAENAGTCIDLMEWIERTKRMNQKPKGAPTPSETEKQKSAI